MSQFLFGVGVAEPGDDPHNPVSRPLIHSDSSEADAGRTSGSPASDNGAGAAGSSTSSSGGFVRLPLADSAAGSGDVELQTVDLGSPARGSASNAGDSKASADRSGADSASKLSDAARSEPSSPVPSLSDALPLADGERGLNGSNHAAAAEHAGPSDEDAARERTRLRRQRVITSAMLLASTLLALFVRNLGLVLSLVGATGSTTITFILPGTVRLAMVDRG